MLVSVIDRQNRDSTAYAISSTDIKIVRYDIIHGDRGSNWTQSQDTIHRGSTAQAISSTDIKIVRYDITYGDRGLNWTQSQDTHQGNVIFIIHCCIFTAHIHPKLWCI